MSEQIYVAAGEVEPGNYIPGLDMAYVEEVFFEHGFSDDFGTPVGEPDGVLITYRDNDHKMGYLFLTPATRIEVLRQ